MKLLLNYLTIILSLFALQNFALAETNTLEKKPKNSQLYQIWIITIPKSLRLEQSGRKQSQGFRRLLPFGRNDNCSTGFYIISSMLKLS